MDESQASNGDTTARHPNAAGDGAIRTATSEAPTQPPSEHSGGGTSQGVSVEVYARQQERLCELEERLQALEKKLDSVIMPLSKQFWIDIRRDLLNIGRTIAQEFNLVSK